MELLSAVRMGISEKIINNISLDTINSLISTIQPATICMVSQQNKELTNQQRDKLRAEIIKKKLA